MNRDGRARCRCTRRQPFGGRSEMDSTWPRHVIVAMGNARSPRVRDLRIRLNGCGATRDQHYKSDCSGNAHHETSAVGAFAAGSSEQLVRVRPRCPESGNKFQYASGSATGRRGLMVLDRACVPARFAGQRHRFEILNLGIVAVAGANAGDGKPDSASNASTLCQPGNSMDLFPWPQLCR